MGKRENKQENKVPRDLKFEKSVGVRIRQLRRELGWSQQKLADDSNMERKQVQRIEGAVHSPKLAILVALAKTLGRQPLELLRTDFHVKVNTNLESEKKVKSDK